MTSNASATVVSVIWQALLQTSWSELTGAADVDGCFCTRRLSPYLLFDAHAGIRVSDNAPCLIIAATAPALSLFSLCGMKLALQLRFI